MISYRNLINHAHLEGASNFVKKRLGRYITVSQTNILLFLSILTGILAGYASVLFHTILEFVRYIFFDVIYGELEKISYLLIFTLPLMGTILLIPFLLIFKDNKGGYGMPNFLVSVHLKGGMIRTKNIFLKMICSAITIGTGGSAGVEGPIAQIGGTVGSSVGRFFEMSSQRVQALIACGAAAGIAAQFNAPIAGVLFAQEVVMLGVIGMEVFGAIIIASGIATAISRAHRSNETLFTVSQYEFGTEELILYAVLGVIIGLLSVVFIRIFLKVGDIFHDMKIPELAKPFLGSLIVGLMGVIHIGALSDGYEFIDRVLLSPSGLALSSIVLLLVFKIIATSITLGSGNFGGVFAPALFIGSMTGALFGHLCDFLFPDYGIETGTYALVGMGAFLAATTHAPLTSIFLLFEITGDYHVIIPVMISSVLGLLVNRHFSKHSIDTADLHRKGISLEQGREVSILNSIKIMDVMEKKFENIYTDMTFSEFLNYLPISKQQYFPVLDRSEMLQGIVSFQDVREFMLEEGLEDLVIMGEVMETNLITITPDKSLSEAMEKFSIKSIDSIPVVDNENSGKMLGVLRRKDVISAYNKAVLMKNIQD